MSIFKRVLFVTFGTSKLAAAQVDCRAHTPEFYSDFFSFNFCSLNNLARYVRSEPSFFIVLKVTLKTLCFIQHWSTYI